MCGGAECGDGVERCRSLDRNALTGSVPSEMGELNELIILYVQTASPPHPKDEDVGCAHSAC